MRRTSELSPRDRMWDQLTELIRREMPQLEGFACVAIPKEGGSLSGASYATSSVAETVARLDGLIWELQGIRETMAGHRQEPLREAIPGQVVPFPAQPAPAPQAADTGPTEAQPRPARIPRRRLRES